jgi:hypothetical protein
MPMLSHCLGGGQENDESKFSLAINCSVSFVGVDDANCMESSFARGGHFYSFSTKLKKLHTLFLPGPILSSY